MVGFITGFIVGVVLVSIVSNGQYDKGFHAGRRFAKYKDE